MERESKIIPQEVIREYLSSVEADKELGKLGGFWSGPDIEIAEKKIIPPESSEEICLFINKESLPHVDLNRNVIHHLQYSTRSRFAQAGIEVEFNAENLSDEDIERINNGEEVSVSATITNHGSRPVELEGGVARFFWANKHNYLSGEELKKTVSSQMEIEGECGKDWFFADADFAPSGKMEQGKGDEGDWVGQHKDVMIVFPIKKKLYIPESKETLRITTRKDLENALMPLPENTDKEFKIGETPKIKMGKDVCAVINTTMYDKGGRHLASSLIDPGFEGPIRAELINDLDYFEIFVYKK